MSSILKTKASSRRSAGLLVLVGVFAGVVVGGGVGVIAASSPGSVTLCANKETNLLRYAKSGTCRKTESPVVLNQTGPTGAKGDTGATGAKGDTGATGAKGDTGAAGAKGDTGAPGADGAAGGGGGASITELSVCDGPDAGTVANELCKIGMTGPGGGPVFFIDSQNLFASFCASGDCNYLEASPADVDEAGSDFTSQWCSDNSTALGLSGWDKKAIGAGRTNTATAHTACTSGAIQTAVDYTAPAFNGVAKDDWWLPSIGELMVMYSNLFQAGAGSFSVTGYWSSSESDATNAYYQLFDFGAQPITGKAGNAHVRPVRGF